MRLSIDDLFSVLNLIPSLMLLLLIAIKRNQKLVFFLFLLLCVWYKTEKKSNEHNSIEDETFL